jgi:hypothetical protein
MAKFAPEHYPDAGAAAEAACHSASFSPSCAAAASDLLGSDPAHQRRNADGLAGQADLHGHRLVIIEPQESRIVDLEQVVQGLPADSANIETQIRVIQSREILKRAVDVLNLLADPAFPPESRCTGRDGWAARLPRRVPAGLHRPIRAGTLAGRGWHRK